MMNAFEVILDLGRWAKAHHAEVIVGAIAIPAMMGLGTYLMRTNQQIASTVHGSARWAYDHEVRKAGFYGRHGVVLGRFAGRVLYDDGEGHVLLVGPTRSKKGVGNIITTLLTWLGSALVLDPKDGENYDVTAKWRSRQAHNRIAYFTPCRSPHACINVGDTIRFKTAREFGDAHTISQSLTAPEKMIRENSTSLHFRELAALLLTAAQLHLGYSTGRCSLARTWSFLTQYYKNLPACLKAMRTTRHTSHGVHKAVLTLSNAIKNITGERELGSVWSTAIRPLVLYNDPLIAKSTETSTFNLEDLQYGLQPLSLYMVAPSPRALRRLHPLYRVVLDVAMTRLMEHKVRTWQHRLLLCADELPTHGYVQAIDFGAADMAGYGMKGLFVGQDIPQFEDAYGKEPSLWGNTHVKIFHTPENDETAHRIAEKMLGDQTVVNPVEQRQAGLSGRRSVSYQQVGRQMLTHDEVYELPQHLEIIRVGGMKPILAEKIDYRDDPAFQGRAA
jgi:type IV secretion system protein VirD4